MNVDLRRNKTRLGAATIAVVAFGLFVGGIEMSFGESIGRFAGAMARGFVSEKSAGDPAYYKNFNRIPVVGGGPKAELANPYKSSVWVMAAINAVTQPIKSVPLKFYRGDNEFEDAALSAFWQAPAVGLSYEEFIDASAGWYKLKGEFFWILDDTWLTAARVKGKLIVARPDAMREQIVAGELLGWEYRDGQGRRHLLLPQQVIQRKRWNPLNPWRGLGELDAAMQAAETDYLAGRYVREAFSNFGGTPDVVAKGNPPTQEQREQIEKALREKHAARLRGDFKATFFSSDLDVKDAQLQLPDADLAASRLQNRHEVFIAFGVPASMADVIASYSIGSASDLFRLIFGTCRPLGATLCSAIEILAQRMTNLADLEAELDWDEHPVMQAVRSERFENAIKLWDRGMSWKDINDLLDLGLKPFKGWDIAYIPFSASPLNEGETTTAPENTPSPAVEDAPAEKVLGGLTRLRSLILGRGREREERAEGSDRDQRRLALAKSHARRRRPMEKAFAAKFGKALVAPRAEVLRNIAAAAHVKGGKTKAAAAELNFTLADFQRGLKTAMRKQSMVALQEAGQAMFAELGKDDVFAMAPKAALAFLSQRENRMADVAEETHDQIGRALQAGLDAGETMDELADRVRGAFTGIGKGRATVVAVTETAAAYGVARHDAMDQAGIQFQQWLTAGDDHVRDSHLACDGEIVPVGQKFSCGLAFPGDPEGAAEEVINCRCVQIAVAGPEENA